MPSVCSFPKMKQGVAEVLRRATRERIPVTISGAGTGVTGGRVPQGGWVLSLEKFSRLEINPGTAFAGAGVLLRDLQAAAAATGQFYAPDPTETTACVGGTIGTNASGSRSFKYGATRRHVLGLHVVLASGEILHVRRGQAGRFSGPFDFDSAQHETRGRLQPCARAWIGSIYLSVPKARWESSPKRN